MYDQIDLGKIQKSGFDLSYNNKGTGRIGRIIPTRCLPVLPGDRIKGSSVAAVQFEPLAVPMLANMYVRQEHFYVPNRIVWKNWDKFFTGGEKLDFTTPPPSFQSIQGVFHVLKTLFGSLSFADIPLLGDSMNPTTYGITLSYEIVQPIVNALVDARAKVVQYGTTTQTLDLLQPCLDVIDDYVKSLRYDYDTGSKVNVFDAQVEPYSKLNSNDQERSQSGFISDLGFLLSFSPDPYEAAIAHAVDNFDFADSRDIAPLTEFGRKYVHFLYDLFKVFVGTSSTLDYLNYERLTLSDMYYSVYYAFYIQGINGDTVRKLSFSDAVFSNNTLNVFALRANYAVWYNYYRDQLLETACPEPSDDDVVTNSELYHLLVPRQRCWSKDTFTTALTNTGTGNVFVPVNTGSTVKMSRYLNEGVDMDAVAANNLDVYELQTATGDKISIPTRFISGLKESTSSPASPQGYFSLDMLDACRRAQKWLQKALIYGNRPQDRLYTSWGVRSLDARLSLPECLATSSQMVQLSVNTNNTTITDAEGNAMSVAGDKSANAYGYDKGGDFNRFCEEHGLIISYLTILPEATYSLHRSREHCFMDKFDYPTPEFATLGMDAVYLSELVCPTANFIGHDKIVVPTPDEVFGYQGRYFGYKSKQDEEHGELQTSQNMYTFARTFNQYDRGNLPKLSYQFVHCFPSLDMFVVDNSLDDYFRYDVHHGIAAERALPVCGMYL